MGDRDDEGTTAGIGAGLIRLRDGILGFHYFNDSTSAVRFRMWRYGLAKPLMELMAVPSNVGRHVVPLGGGPIVEDYPGQVRVEWEVVTPRPASSAT